MSKLGHFKFCFVIVNYFQFSSIKSLVKSLNNSAPAPCYIDIYIVDNSSDITSFDDYPVTILKPKSNLGYFAGFNFFLSEVDHSIYDRIIFCNPDLVFSISFLSELCSTAVGLSSSDIIAPSVIDFRTGHHQNPSLLARPGFIRRFYYAMLYSSYIFFLFFSFLSYLVSFLPFSSRSSLSNVDSTPIYLCHGSCFILSPSFFFERNHFVCPSFLWGEEMFLRHQCQQMGGQIYYHPSLIVSHISHSSTSLVSSHKRYAYMKFAYNHYKTFI